MVKFVRITVNATAVTKWLNMQTDKEKFYSLLKRQVNQSGVELEFKYIHYETENSTTSLPEKQSDFTDRDG